MAKSIHERVRAAMEKRDRDEQRAKQRAAARMDRAAEKYDSEFERGQAAYADAGFLPPGASKAMRDGFAAAERAEFAEFADGAEFLGG